MPHIESLMSRLVADLTNDGGSLVLADKCNFYMIFIILLFIKIVSFPLFDLI